MNKKQRHVGYLIVLLILISAMLRPTINWKVPSSEQERTRFIQYIKQTNAGLNRIHYLYIPFVILSVGGLVIYFLRDKKK